MARRSFALTIRLFASTHPQMMRALISIWCCALLVACSQDSGIPAPEDFVFVPAKDYTISVEIVVPHEAVVGEWIPLRAISHRMPAD